MERAEELRPGADAQAFSFGRIKLIVILALVGLVVRMAVSGYDTYQESKGKSETEEVSPELLRKAGVLPVEYSAPISTEVKQDPLARMAQLEYDEKIVVQVPKGSPIGTKIETKYNLLPGRIYFVDMWQTGTNWAPPQGLGGVVATRQLVRISVSGDRIFGKQNGLPPEVKGLGAEFPDIEGRDGTFLLAVDRPVECAFILTRTRSE